MAKALMTKESLPDLLKAASHLVKLPVGRFWVDYDEEADVLYLSFKRPQKATDSEMLENGVLLRYKGDELIGVTILEASKR